MIGCQLIVMFVSLLLFIVNSIFRIVISHEFSFVIFKSTTCMLLLFNSIIKYVIERERERERERESLCLHLNYFH